ncbi:T9SS type A sorting domain-containing protein [Wenyingzhuangia aestuarii]|uniref:T9SS type A sorting domain-containing protein n=1 Tax=Wenyingzhuangia aestuarii TaxID=1647582 RepID=UPI00143C3CD2|nr:T9SS type A sorting domain-containing protein [Wenyingzhuangia aestuarii]NJB83778.1 dUTPase [Wenyingzhuangia aestuarii]
MKTIFLKSNVIIALLLSLTIQAQVPTPGGVEGTVLWLKANAGTNTTTNGVGITSWTDQSGNGFNATGTGAAVYSTTNAINGNPVISFTDDSQPITGTTITRGVGPNSSTEESTSFIVQRKSATTDDCFIEFYEGSSRQFYIDRRYDANEPFFTLPTGIQQIISVSDPGGSGSGANSTIYLNSKNFFTSENLFSTTWENGAYVIGDDSTSGNELNGEIAEIIYFDYELSIANRKKIESYLAIKYGITLDNTDGGTDGDYSISTGAVIWDASENIAYHNEVIGIGRDDSTALDQRKSTEFNSDPTVSIEKTTSFSTDLDYLLIGNDADPLAFTTTGVPGSITNKSGRTWKVETNGTPGTISVSFTLGTSLTNSGNPSEYALLIDTNTDFTTGATIHTTGASISGNVLTFTNVSLADASFFTLAYTPVNEFPGNVSTGLTHWFKADTGITTDVNGITDWGNQATTGSSNNAVRNGTVSSDYPAVETDKHNYNSSVYFSNGDNGYFDLNLDDIKDNDYSVLAVVERTNTNDHNYFLGTTSTVTNQSLRLGYRNNNTNPRGLFHHQGSGNSVSSSFVSYNASTEEATLYRAVLDIGVERNISLLMSGIEYENDNSNFSALTGTAAGVLGKGNSTVRGFEGYMSELIIYNTAISGTDLNKIESYLALKYALSLDNSSGGTDGDYIDSNANVIWDASENSIYHNEIIGIGRDDASALNQQKSSEPISSTNLTLDKAGSFNNNLDFLVVGNDNGTIGVTSSGTSPVYSERIERTWKAAVSGTVGGVTISITLPIASTGNTSDYALLIDSDTDFSDSNIHTTGVSLDGNTVTFTNVNLSDGDVFTLGIGLSFGPANVTTGLTHWFRADDGIPTPTEGVAITQWDNLKGTNHAIQAGTTNYPSYAENLHNYNPSVYFTNGNEGYFNVNLDDLRANDYNIITVIERDDVKNVNYFLGTTSSGTGNQRLHVGYRTNTSLTLAQYGNDVDVTVGGYNPTTSSSSLITASLDQSSGKTIAALKDGIEVSNNDGNTTALGGDGGLSNGFLGNAYDTATQGFEGAISEMIIYNSTLTNTELKKIHSYLAIKYGITLDNSGGGTNGDYLDSAGNTIWDASENSAYHNDVAGIGYDVASNLIQKQSKSESSDDILAISIYSSVTATNKLNFGAFDDNLDYLVWGNNGSTSSISLVDHISSENACLKQFDRDWKISNSGNVQNVTLQFDLSAFSSRDFNLIIDLDGDGDYTTGTIQTISTGTITGNNIIFTDVTLPNDCVFTLVDNSSDIVYKVGAWVGGAGTDQEFNDSATDLVKSVKISEDVTLTGSHNCKCLNIANGAVVTVATDEYLKVTNTLISNGSIYLEGSAELIQTDTDTNTGTGKVYKILNEATSSIYRYNYFASPVHNSGVFSIGNDLKINEGPTLGDNSNPGFINNDLDGFGTTFSTRWFHTLNNDFDFIEIDQNTTMAPGIGFTMKGTSTANAYNFIGTPNNGDIDVAISTGKFLLTGNPYPSTIDIDAFNTTNGPSGSGVTEGAVYIWDQPGDTGDHFNADTDDSGGYATIINGVKTAAKSETDTPVAGATLPTAYIKPGQGFIVYGTDDGSVSFTNSLRDGITYDGGRKFFKTQQTKTLESLTERPIIRLGFEYQKENGKYAHRQLATVLESGSTLEKEIGKDAFMFDYHSNDAYWMVENDIDRFIITSVPTLSETLELPIGVVVDSEKEVTFNIDDVENLANDIYLLDKEQGNVAKISGNNTYTTTVASGEHQDRFSLVFKEAENLDTEYIDNKSKTVIYIQNKTMNVVLEQGTIQQVEIYNLGGQKVVAKKNNTESTKMTINLEKLLQQLYLVKITTNKGSFTEKIAIE